MTDQIKLQTTPGAAIEPVREREDAPVGGGSGHAGAGRYLSTAGRGAAAAGGRRATRLAGTASAPSREGAGTPRRS